MSALMYTVVPLATTTPELIQKIKIPGTSLEYDVVLVDNCWVLGDQRVNGGCCNTDAISDLYICKQGYYQMSGKQKCWFVKFE